jgi:hypothetical protein
MRVDTELLNISDDTKKCLNNMCVLKRGRFITRLIIFRNIVLNRNGILYPEFYPVSHFHSLPRTLKDNAVSALFFD